MQLLVAIIVCIAVTVQALTSSVTTEYGVVTGTLQNIPSSTTGQQYYKWLGIPFSAPPIGNLRWMPPQKHNGYNGAYQALEPKLCYQVMGGQTLGNEAYCNNVNIWAPKRVTSSPTLLPVMVWIHGGSFVDANPALDVYDGTNLVKTSMDVGKEVIVVSIQYRLGGLGFMAHPKLSLEAGSNGSSGNYGMLDQIMALQWIQDNIAAFGGDKSKVTIFGESAGAYSVCALLASPLATGKFSGAIAESSYCANLYQPKALAEGVGAYCSSINQCGGATSGGPMDDDNGGPNDSEMTCLRNLTPAAAYTCDATHYAGASKNDGGLGYPGLLQVMPNIDGYFLYDTPLNSIMKGTANDQNLPNVPIIFGSNADEMMAFAVAGVGGPYGTTDDGLKTQIAAAFATTGQALTASVEGKTMDDIEFGMSDANLLASTYIANDYNLLTTQFQEFTYGLCTFEPTSPLCVKGAITNAYRRYVASQTDLAFTSTQALVTGAMSKRGLKSFRYLFNQNGVGSTVALLGAFHTLDEPFVFNNFASFISSPSPTWVPPPELQDLSMLMQKYWITFAYNGDPNPIVSDTSMPVWPVATNTGNNYMELKARAAGTAGSGTASSPSSGYRQLSVNFFINRALNEDNPVSPPPGTTSKTDSASNTSGALPGLIITLIVLLGGGGFFVWKKKHDEKAEAINAAKMAALADTSASNPVLDASKN